MVDNPVLTKAEADYFASRGTKTPEPEQGETQATEPVAQEPAEPEQEPEEEQHDERRVPLAALHEERTKRKELADRLAEAERKSAEQARLFEERFARLQQQFQPPAQVEPPKMPDPVTDPMGYVQQIGQTAQQTQEQMQRFMQAQEAQRQEQQVRGWAAAQEATFRQSAPDYQDAINHLMQSRTAELTTMGFDANAIQQQMAVERDALMFQAMQRQMNPAELAYNLAKQRGYTGKAPETPSAEERAETIQRGQDLGRRVPSNGASPQSMTAAALLEMSPREFDEWTRKHPAQARRLMGE